MWRAPMAAGVCLLACSSLAHSAVQLVCTQVDNDRKESLVLQKDKTWSSAPGGWLKADKGTWIQKVREGVVIENHDKKEIAFIHGFVFTEASNGQTWVMRFDGGGNSGQCIAQKSDL